MFYDKIRNQSKAIKVVEFVNKKKKKEVHEKAEVVGTCDSFE